MLTHAYKQLESLTNQANIHHRPQGTSPPDGAAAWT